MRNINLASVKKESEIAKFISHANVGPTRVDLKKIDEYKPSIHKLVSVAVGFVIGII